MRGSGIEVPSCPMDGEEWMDGEIACNLVFSGVKARVICGALLTPRAACE